MSLLLQSAVAVATSPGLLGGHATDAGIAALLAINVWQLKATLAYRDDAARFRQWAFGENGTNGVNSKIKAWEKLSELRSRVLDNHEGRLVNLEGGTPVHIHQRATDA